MGLKSGSRDAGLDDDTGSDSDTPDGSDADTTGESKPDAGSVQTENTRSSAESSETNSGANDAATGDSQRPTMESIPYKLRREKVNEGREQVPFFLREDVIAAEDDLQDALEEQLGEEVYKSDYREAAMVVAQRHPDLLAGVLREWGYDLD